MKSKIEIKILFKKTNGLINQKENSKLLQSWLFDYFISVRNFVQSKYYGVNHALSEVKNDICRFSSGTLYILCELNSCNRSLCVCVSSLKYVRNRIATKSLHKKRRIIGTNSTNALNRYMKHRVVGDDTCWCFAHNLPCCISDCVWRNRKDENYFSICNTNTCRKHWCGVNCPHTIEIISAAYIIAG